jgi:hypothetical protein
MISSSHRLPENVGLPELNLNKYTLLHLPPVINWEEAQSLAKTVSAEPVSDKSLRSACWRFAGSLGAMVAQLQNGDTAAYSPAPLKGASVPFVTC